MAAESNIQGKIRVYLMRHGYWTVKINLCSRPGFPDMIAIGMKHIFFIETKAPNKTPDPLQLYIHEVIRKRGFDVLVADDKQIVVDYIQNRKK